MKHFQQFIQSPRSCIVLMLALAILLVQPASAQEKTFHVLAFYSTDVERDHVMFAEQAIDFFNKTAVKDHFEFKTTSNWDDLNEANLSKYQVVLWLDEFPHSAPQRTAFEHYMESGGGWLGFHIAAYSDEGTHWPWLLKFLGGGVFYGNSWPPLPALLKVDDTKHPATKHLPAHFTSPSNEWYSWIPDPRDNKDVKVLVTLDPSNYPLGMKDTLTGGDIPVVWTNTHYRMLYTNMGHGDHIFDDKLQNAFFEDSLMWLGSQQQSH